MIDLEVEYRKQKRREFFTALCIGVAAGWYLAIMLVP